MANDVYFTNLNMEIRRHTNMLLTMKRLRRVYSCHDLLGNQAYCDISIIQSPSIPGTPSNIMVLL